MNKPKSRSPHYSLRSLAFYIIWAFLTASTIADGDIAPALVAWLSFIVLMLTQIYDIVWDMVHPRPEKKEG